MKTIVTRAKDINQDWFLVDAEGQVLGRMASQVAHILRGKHKPTFCTYLDGGDHVVVVNAEKVTLTGKKLTDKFHYQHSNYPGGIKATAYGKMLAEKPEETFMLAVKRMLPRTPLGRKMLTKLRVYAGPEHPHKAQNPTPLTLKG